MTPQEGKILPSAPELEKVVVASVMLDRNAIAEICERLRPEMFYDDVCRMIYEAALQLHNDIKAVDLMTITQQLRKNQNLELCGGAFSLMTLMQNVNNSANLQSHALYIEEMWLKRNLIAITATFNAKGYNDSQNVFGLIDGLENALFELTAKLTNGKEAKIDVPYYNVIKSIEAVKEGAEPGIMTYISDVDNHIRGFKPGNLVIVAGRPGMGKSAFITTILTNMASNNVPCVLFSLEMEMDEVAGRVMANINNIPLDYIVHKDLRGKFFDSAMEGISKVNKMPLYIDDTAGINLPNLRSKLRRMVQKYGIRVAVVDYMQLMNSEYKNGRSRENEVTELSKGLKQLAKELKIPIIALSQLSRKVEERTTKRPMLSDLRESGSIEQDADMVCFLYRPSYYQILNDEDGNPYPQDYAELMIEKYRSGKLGRIGMKYIGEYTRFQNLLTDFERNAGVFGEKGFTEKDLF